MYVADIFTDENLVFNIVITLCLKKKNSKLLQNSVHY